MKVFQRRIDSSLDFYRDWNEYETGFGSADGNFWLGNEKLSAVTSQGQYELRIDFVSKSGQHHYAKYSSFSVGNAGTNYRLSVSGYDSSSSVGEYTYFRYLLTIIHCMGYMRAELLFFKMKGRKRSLTDFYVKTHT